MILDSKLFFIFETLLLFVLPQFLIQVYPPLVHYRLLVMALGLIYVFLVAKSQHWNLTTLGFNFIFLPSVMFISIFLGLALLLQPSLVFVTEVAQEAQNYPAVLVLLFYILISVPLQEILFRGFYINRLKLISTNKYFLVIFSAFIFGLIHLPLQNKLIALGTFLVSIWWAHLFLKHRSLLLSFISHALIGGSLVLLTLL